MLHALGILAAPSAKPSTNHNILSLAGFDWAIPPSNLSRLSLGIRLGEIQQRRPCWHEAANFGNKGMV